MFLIKSSQINIVTSTRNCIRISVLFHYISQSCFCFDKFVNARERLNSNNTVIAGGLVAVDEGAKYTILVSCDPFYEQKKNISEYDQEIPQSHTADKPMAP